jgi:preprotein translocase subunit SecG
MSTFILILIVIVAVLLVIVVLAQNPKGGGLASGFGGSSATQFMGVKKTGDFLESTTWVLAILLLSLSLTANIMVSSPSDEDNSGSINVENAKENKKAPTPGSNGSTEELAPSTDSVVK